ncbi:MAG: alpha/beta fold hydrolase [Exilispira sp.]
MEHYINKEKETEIVKKILQPVYFEESFNYQNNNIKFSVSSERGLEFLSDGLNQYHNYGFKKCFSADKKRSFDLFFQYWLLNSSSPSILFFHGNAENSSTHPKFFYHLLLNGYNIFTFDNIGHGSSSGVRGSIEKYLDYIDVANQLFQFFINIKNQKVIAAKKFKKETKKNKLNSEISPIDKWIIMGFSFGGLIATDFALNSNYKQIKDVILFSPWFMTNKRLLNNFLKIYLLLFNKFFNSNSLMNYKLQEDIYNMDEEAYINLNKNLTDNKEFLKIRKKDTRIFRLISKKRLSEIYKAQLKLFKNENSKNLNFYLFLPENDLIVDSSFSKKIIGKFKGEYFELKDCFHDFLDYQDYRWDCFSEILNICLTKILK